MLPSSGGQDQARSSQLRRWGPLAAVVVLVLIIGAVVLASGKDDKKSGTAASSGSAQSTSSGSSTDSGSASTTGAISYSEAQRTGRKDLTFPSCDTGTGRIAMPFHFAAECYANQPNAGATAKGVTADAIKVVVYIRQESDPVLKYINAAIANDDTNAQIEETYRGYTELFQKMYQSYGRTVQIQFLEGSGIATDSVAARADAVKATEEMGAFAVWGGPALAPAWTEEVKAHGVICLGCPAINENAPVVFPVTASAEQTRVQLSEYIVKKLKGGKAVHAGDPALQSQDRKLGELYIDTGGDEQKNAADLKARLGKEGVDVAVQIPYTLDPGRLQEEAVNAITQLKSAGVTSVILVGDPVAPGAFTTEATKQAFSPEWIIGGSALMDTTAFGRSYDQAQWAHAFGISSLSARVVSTADPSLNLYKWFKGTDAPAFDTSGVIFPQPSLFFAGLQAAGPNLTAETFRQGLFELVPASTVTTSPTISYGNRNLYPGLDPDYNGIDDFTEIWWDPAATGPDEIRREAAGMLRYSDGGKRYLPGQWTKDDKAFVQAGSVDIFKDLPADAKPKAYPPPGG